MNNACVIGYGMVGKAFSEVFGIKKIFTRLPEESTISLEEASKCRLIFICLPSPINFEGHYLLDPIKDIIKQIEGYNNGPIYVIRSTVGPGFANALQEELGINRIISNPEFLSEATAVEDTKSPPFILIGGFEGKFRDEVAAFYNSIIKGSSIIMTDNTTAELAKLAMNAYFATKVIFANETYNAAKLNKANYSVIKKVLEKHPFGPKNHFDIWFRNKRGVHGHCLPKDSKAFAYYGSSNLVRKVVELNDSEYAHLREDNI